ncbi:hypothetical protein MA47_04680 [Corynebacterium auriscanis]|uniref:Uncharacterized protein n=1 Tax=Corynebacterium auriscanis TaxID=99807 RepID=A0A0A2DI81_9CORY|nr:hypothetical protein MA47_04680 [Corynebacterium auriscanis]
MITAFSAVVTALAIFILPGAVVGWCAGMRIPWALATGVVITAGVWNVLAWWYGGHDIAVTFDSLLQGTAVFAVVGLLWRLTWTATVWRRGRRARQLERELMPRAELEGYQHGGGAGRSSSGLGPHSGMGEYSIPCGSHR